MKPMRHLVAALSVAVLAVAGSGGTALADTAPGEMLGDSTFTTDTGQWWGNDVDIRATNGELEADVPSGGFGDLPGGIVNPWDHSIGYSPLSFTGQQLYTLSFDARATRDVTLDVSVYTYNTGQYIPYWDRPFALTTTMQHFEVPVAMYYTASERSLGFQVGTYGPAYNLYLDNISLVPTQSG